LSKMDDGRSSGFCLLVIVIAVTRGFW